MNSPDLYQEFFTLIMAICFITISYYNSKDFKKYQETMDKTMLFMDFRAMYDNIANTILALKLFKYQFEKDNLESILEDPADEFDHDSYSGDYGLRSLVFNKEFTYYFDTIISSNDYLKELMSLHQMTLADNYSDMIEKNLTILETFKYHDSEKVGEAILNLIDAFIVIESNIRATFDQIKAK